MAFEQQPEPQFNVKKHNIPLDHLDYKYVESCSNLKELEKIYKVLQSGVEGTYPDLERFVEDKIRSLDPKNRVLRKDAPVLNKDSIRKNEKIELDNEINEFLKSIPNLEKEIERNNLDDEDNSVPPVRSVKEPIGIKTTEIKKVQTTTSSTASTTTTTTKKSVKPRDYREWDKLEKNIDEELNKIDSEETIKPVKKDTPKVENDVPTKNPLLKTIPTKIDPKIEKLDDTMKAFKADQEKQKGNEAFNSKSYDEAVVYYTRSLQYVDSAASYNNRALAYLKLEKWDKVIDDCNSVFKYEKDNIKALLRRATACFNKKLYKQAKEDIEKVLKKEPNDQKAKELAEKIKNAYNEDEKEKEKVEAKGGKRIMIEETDGDSSDEDNEMKVVETVNVNSPADIQEITTKVTETFIKDEVVSEDNATFTKEIHQEIKVETTEKVHIELPHDVVNYKNEAYKLFTNGQYGDAISFYTKAIDVLVTSTHDYSNALSVLYQNRGTCKEKNGDLKEAIKDFNLSLSVNEMNLKALYKKAHLYELLEKYNESLNAYEKLMRLDSSMKQAQDGYNRVKRVVQNQMPVPSIDRSKMFDEYKLKGNEYVKVGDYENACVWYTKCIDLDKMNPVAYLNRSLCFLKLNKFNEVLNDCNFVIQNEKQTNVKALYRRSLAYKGLKQYENALHDLDEVLKIEPKNEIALKEMTEIRSELVKLKKAEKKVIEDVVTTPKSYHKVNLPTAITNSYEFLQAWNSINPNDIETYCELLEKIDASKLSKFIGSKLDNEMFTRIIKTFYRYVFDSDCNGGNHGADEEYDIIYNRKLDKLAIFNYLTEFRKTQRFDIIKLFADDNIKVMLNKLFDYFNQNGVKVDDMNLLKKVYGV